MTQHSRYPAHFDYLFEQQAPEDEVNEVREVLEFSKAQSRNSKLERDHRNGELKGLSKGSSQRNTSNVQRPYELKWKPYVRSLGEVAQTDPGELVPTAERTFSYAAKVLRDHTDQNRENQRKTSAGPGWFHMPGTNLTPELRRDIQVLRMRYLLDPKRHYKKESGNNKPPHFSQTGTIIEGATEFYSSRLTKRERRNNLIEDVLAEEYRSKSFMRKYRELQAKKTNGKKTYYKSVQGKRSRNYA